MVSRYFPNKRYLFRELLPRAILLTVTFKFVLPVVPLHLFEFHGGAFTSAALGVLYTAMFSVFGANIMSADPVQNFLKRNQSKWWFIPANALLIFSVPAIALLVTALILPEVFVIAGFWSVVAGSVILNVACAITHDYGASG